MSDIKTYIDEKISNVQASFPTKDQIKSLICKEVNAILEDQKPTEEELQMKSEEQLQQIVQLLQNNLYEVIPTYQEVEENVSSLIDQVDVCNEEIQRITRYQEDLNESNNQIKESIEYLKGRFGPTFVSKIDKTFTSVGAMEYDLSIFKGTVKTFVTKSEMEIVEKHVA